MVVMSTVVVFRINSVTVYCCIDFSRVLLNLTRSIDRVLARPIARDKIIESLLKHSVQIQQLLFNDT